MLTLLTDNLALWAQGLQNTVALTLLSALMGFSLALPLALARLSRNRTISGVAYGYIYLMRGTPLLVQVFLIY
ncbi:ABC transporter permease subunit, partial [Rhizobium ruizarguesonis]